MPHAAAHPLSEKPFRSLPLGAWNCSACANRRLSTGTVGLGVALARLLVGGCISDARAGDSASTGSDTSMTDSGTGSVDGSASDSPGPRSGTAGSTGNTAGTTGSTASDSTATEPPQPDLRYSFDGHALDEVGNADGVEVGPITYVAGYDGLAASFGLWVGGHWTDSWFDGLIDELLIFERSLSDEQVLAPSELEA
jgi:hypothetical protein